MSSTRTTSPTASQCCKFQAHHLRPEKCRNCFGDASQHSVSNDLSIDGAQDGARPQTPTKTTGGVAQNSAGNSNDSTNYPSDSQDQNPSEQNEDTTSSSTSRARLVQSPTGRPAMQAAGDESQCKGCQEKLDLIDKLRQEVDQWQKQCQLAELDSQRAREELRSLEDEVEELHDNFKEEESEQFEQVKQELDAALKNCKILQIRLNKSERQYNQLEQVKMMLEKQLEENQQQQKLNHHQQASRQNSSECPKLYEMSSPSSDHVSVPTSEYDQLLRDLNDTSERERDLQEQIKYSQEEAQLKGERLQVIEAENEILMGQINKLTLANSNLRSSLLSASLHQQHQHDKSGASTGAHHHQQQQRQQQQQAGAAGSGDKDATSDKLRDLYEQNEQLKLALEMAAAECQRLKVKLDETQQALEMREKSLQEMMSKPAASQSMVASVSGGDSSRDCPRDSGESIGQQAEHITTTPPQHNIQLELECRQLRARLAHSERECRQLRSQLELLASSSSGRQTKLLTTPRSYSMEAAPNSDASGQSRCSSAQCQDTIRKLDQQCQGLLERNNQLELKLQRLCQFSSQDLDQKTSMESDLFDKLKRQLESSENELATAKSRLVELDIECGRVQRQYKRLLGSLDTCGTSGGELQMLRRNRLGSESARDSMSRQELRQALRDLELDIDELLTIVRAKECLVKEMQREKLLLAPDSAGNEQYADSGTLEQQTKSLRRLLDQEQLLSNNLKLEVANLERANMELASRSQLVERERAAMEEELEKLRQLNGEFQAELEESRREKQLAVNKSRELNEQVERIRFELNQVRQQQNQDHKRALAAANANNNDSKSNTQLDNNNNNNSGNRSPTDGSASTSSAPSNADLLLMARDLSELKVKNGFLMRQLEMAREDTVRQLEELRTSSEAQLRRAVELAQIELKERHLQETQQLRDELNDCKQKLASLQRQASRQEEETALERDRARAIERDWRRDKSQWHQAREQLEGQLAIEKRSSEFRLKEAEVAIRDKERQLINVQDKCVQLERDLKRTQNKYRLLEEDSESKLKQLTRDIDMKTKELAELSGQKQAREERQYEQLKRLRDEKSTLKEGLESLRRSYDEKLVEARQLRELLHSRQEQYYKERSQQFERIEALTRRVNELSELETQAKLLKQRLEMQERQCESSRRELAQVREERSRLKSRCDELEKRELISKTSSISGNPASSFFKPFGSPRSQLLGSARATSPQRLHNQTASSVDQQQVAAASQQTKTTTADQSAATSEQRQSMIEKLSGKISDQRNLINILRQQLSETQVELKQLKLLQASERSKWQARVAQLMSRLNECEEKLAYETSLLNKSHVLLDQLARPRLELAWSQERQANLELIQQQQAQIELLAKDLKKTSQAHDLLRLHSKQLESHNSKLSKKLIEYQQQTNIYSLQDRQLELNYDKLLQRNTKLTQEVRPLLDIVTKIVASLDAPDQQQQQQTRSSRLMSDSTDRPLRAGLAFNQRLPSVDSNDSDEPQELVASKPSHLPGTSRLARLLAGGSGGTGSSSSKQLQGSASHTDSQTAGGDRHKVKRPTKRVRVKCSTLGITTGEKKLLKEILKTLGEALSADPASQRQHHVIIRKSTTITTTKSSSATATPVATAATTTTNSGQQAQPQVGTGKNSSAIPVGINRQAATSGGSASYSARAGPGYEHSRHSGQQIGEQYQRQQLRSQSQSRAADYETATDQSSQQSSQQTTTSRVHWQLDSDMESDCSWSVAAGSAPLAAASLYEPSAHGRANLYSRFPQAGPTTVRGHSCGPLGTGSGGGASLTDYESESSLASDYSVSTFAPLQVRRPGAPSGAESDSGLAGYSASGSKRIGLGRKKSSSGLKGRLTSTLRNISRSITGGLGGSDTEDFAGSNVGRPRTRADKASKAATNLKEIRV